MTTLVLLLTLGLPPGELARVTAAPGAVVIERSPEGAVSVTIPTSHGHVVVVVDGTTGGDDAPPVPAPSPSPAPVPVPLEPLEQAAVVYARAKIAATATALPAEYRRLAGEIETGQVRSMLAVIDRINALDQPVKMAARSLAEATQTAAGPALARDGTIEDGRTLASVFRRIAAAIEGVQ